MTLHCWNSSTDWEKTNAWIKKKTIDITFSNYKCRSKKFVYFSEIWQCIISLKVGSISILHCIYSFCSISVSPFKVTRAKTLKHSLYGILVFFPTDRSLRFDLEGCDFRYLFFFTTHLQCWPFRRLYSFWRTLSR